MAGGGAGNGEATAESLGTRPSQQTTSKYALGCIYMLSFNLLCTYAWARVFLVLVRHVLDHGLAGVTSVSAWPETEEPLFFAQSLAVLEIVHALLGGFSYASLARTL